MSATINIILDTRRMKKRTTCYPVKIRVTFKRMYRDYLTFFDLSEEDFKKLNSKNNIQQELLSIRIKLKEIESTVAAFIKEMGPFNFVEFENDCIKDNPFFKHKRIKEMNLPMSFNDFDFTPFMNRFHDLFEEDHSRPGCISIVYLFYIKTLLRQGRIGSAINYITSYRSLKKFKGNVLFQDISVTYLYEYEQWMLSKNLSKTYIGIVLRSLRTIFNEAIELKIIKREKCYPFGRRKYQIPTSRNIKKALGMKELKLIYYHQPFCELQKKAKNLWLFCYFANGINVKDMVYLKYKNIDGEFLYFERAKTEHTGRGNPKLVTVYMTEDINTIIQKYGNDRREPNDYIFPFMREGLTPLQQFDLVNFVRSFINEGMSAIREQLSIEKKITSIVCRHTFSTQMKRSGVSTEFIQEALGHTDKRTTENYLDSFENEMKKQISGKLTAFKDERLNEL